MAEDAKDDKGILDIIGPKFLERFKSGKRTEIGYVKDVTENQNGVFVDCTNTHGEPGTFMFDKKSARFKDAQDGFAVGDYITMEVSGSRILSVRPMKLNQKEKGELAAKFKSVGEDG